MGFGSERFEQPLQTQGEGLVGVRESIRLGKLEERRATRRYTLQIEIRLESNLKEFEPILGRTRDISTHGFYFSIGQGVNLFDLRSFSNPPEDLSDDLPSLFAVERYRFIACIFGLQNNRMVIALQTRNG